VTSESPSTGITLPVRLRQSRPEPSNLMGVVALGVIVWTFAGFVPFWLQTGSWRIGNGGTYTVAGGVVWLGPILVWGIVYALGPRSLPRRLWMPPIRVTVDRQALRWVLSNGTEGSTSWDGLGGVSYGVDHRARWRNVFDRDGGDLFTFAAPLVDEATGRKTSLPLVVGLARPDLFEPLDPSHPDRAVVRRGVGGTTASGEQRAEVGTP